MRVVSWNIELGLEIDRAAHDLTTTEEIRDPDILLVQEMSEPATEKLAGLLGLDYRYFAPADHPTTGLPFGNAILSPWPMGGADSTDLPHTARVQGQPRAATSAVVHVDGTPIAAFSVHIETVLLGLNRRVEQVGALSATARRLPAPHVVVGGDFNTASLRSIRRFDRALEDARLRRVSSERAPTFRRFGRPFALDHLYTRGLSPVRAGVASTAKASDHLPIWATFSFDEPQP